MEKNNTVCLYRLLLFRGALCSRLRELCSKQDSGSDNTRDKGLANGSCAMEETSQAFERPSCPLNGGYLASPLPLPRTEAASRPYPALPHVPRGAAEANSSLIRPELGLYKPRALPRRFSVQPALLTLHCTPQPSHSGRSLRLHQLHAGVNYQDTGSGGKGDGDGKGSPC